MSDQKPHASMHLKVIITDAIRHKTIGVVDFDGCQKCIEESITLMLLHDQKFKEMMNRCIRAANEIKAKTQN